ncbi:MAG: glyoxalase [Crocinitomicaceae bacterium]|nr:glyoxalase [Crocinitomicaceae bacterium]
MNLLELKPFIPAKDFKLSKKFYLDIGFTLEGCNNQLAHFSFQKKGFLLQNFYNKELASNMVLHLLVDDAHLWWKKWKNNKIDTTYNVLLSEPENQPWGMCDFTLHDPSGILWRISHSI